MTSRIESKVENFYLKQSSGNEKINVLVVDSFPELGKVTALRFIEHIASKPNSVISLPTGKTPEFFIKWVTRILTHWSDDPEIVLLRRSVGLDADAPPTMSEVKFVQMDEFCPISPLQTNSYNSYINRFYIDQFGIKDENCLLIDTFSIISNEEELDAAKKNISEYCKKYEEKIKSWGGIDFFLGGIGPDGHIAFNIGGTCFDSETHLGELNYESLASSAAEALGGMQSARKKMVITIGLKTIVSNPECVAIIFASGEAKANVVKQAVVDSNDSSCPSHALRKLPNACFYLTKGAAKGFRRGEVTREQAELESFSAISTFTRDKIINKYMFGHNYEWKKIVHTEPHHDDILLGYMPLILQRKGTENTFVCGTSGYNSVSNVFLLYLLELAQTYVYEDNFDCIALYVKGVQEGNSKFVEKALAMNILTNYASRPLLELKQYVASLYPGQRDNVRSEVFELKSRVREFESEVLWALCGHYNVHHLRLGFYTSEVFAPKLDYGRDVLPIRALLETHAPDCVTVALDPESSGPDTHYKMLQSVTAALAEFPNIRIIGYRNVWCRFFLWEATMIIPISLSQIEKTKILFETCYLSQKSAEFPSYLFDGPFSTLASNTWKLQLDEFKQCLPNFELPKETAGMLFLKEMSLTELEEYSTSMRNRIQF